MEAVFFKTVGQEASGAAHKFSESFWFPWSLLHTSEQKTGGGVFHEESGWVFVPAEDYELMLFWYS
jgi:hypothetical protein